ncbi:MAG: hypothetical protein IAE96_07440 [Chitinophagaceae bacterium]|nr:hypothetical protein [Chitinophagaceae bacterium]
MKFISITVFTSFIILSCTPKCFVNISKKIQEECIGNTNWTGVSFQDLRIKLYHEGKLDFLHNGFDTLYILESYEIESGGYLGRIWSSKGVLNYTYNKSGFSFDHQRLFTDYTAQLIQNWDTTAIRAEEKINANKLPEKYIYGVRVIRWDKKLQIECIRFKEFFKLERDR